MQGTEVIGDALGRVQEEVHAAVAGLTPEQLAFRIDGKTNSIAWLIWHLTRIQDDHVADVAGTEQLWTAAGWFDRFGLPYSKRATGYGHRSADVEAVRVESGELLTGYFDAVHESTIAYVRRLRDADLDRVVDSRWDPPVTLGVRLVSVISDDLQHVGQAAFVRGVLGR